VAGAGDRNVAKAGVEQVRVDAGIGVNEDAFGGEALDVKRDEWRPTASC
jgi:hypothetical protein